MWEPCPRVSGVYMIIRLGEDGIFKGAFPYTRQRRAAAAAATYITIYGSNPEIIIPYIVM